MVKSHPADGQATGNFPADDANTAHQLQQQLSEKEEAHKRALADYQNLLRRVSEERKQIISQANQDLLTDLLPTLDHLQLAVQHFPDKSLQMIVQDFGKTLEQYGLKPMGIAVGEAFDPQRMEVTDTQPGKENTILAITQPGYELNNTVLRYAKVVVGNGKKN